MTSKASTNLKFLTALTCFLNFNIFGGLVIAQSQCKTPFNEDGYCLPYQQCTKYLEQMRSQLSSDKFGSFLKQLRCNNDQNVHLCCDELYLTPTSLFGTNSYVSSLNEAGLKLLSSIETCGDSSSNRVAFGAEAKLREFPWMALLEYESSDPNPYYCGGSLITNRFVLTAAHCVAVKENIVGVILGEHNIDTDPDCQKRGSKLVCSPKRERYGVEKIIPHPEYRKHYFGFDIGLIKLSEDVSFKKHIMPICLPITPFTLEEHQRFIIAGWGTTENGQSSKVLKKAAVEYQERSVCERIFRRQRITSHHLCIGGGGPVDTCKGDSGGPLFVPTTYLPSKSRVVQYGIVSFGNINCSALEKYPAIYTNVTEFMPWITSTIIS